MPHLPCPATPEFVGVAGFFCCRMTLPLWYPVGDLPPAALAIPATVVPYGGLAFFAARLPCLWFVVLPPIPPTPFPGGEGGDFFVFLCKGLRPLHPRHLTVCGTYSFCRCGTRRGGGLPPAALAVPAAVVSGGRACPRRHWLTLPRGRGPSQTPPSLATDSSISPGPPSPWLPALLIGNRFLSFLRQTMGSARGCKGRSPLHKKTISLPLPRRGRGLGG